MLSPDKPSRLCTVLVGFDSEIFSVADGCVLGVALTEDPFFCRFVS